ncbi:HAMP domain-containing histidine kinase [Actinoplanes hulinensis]|uniref:histidine kinase n=1 Tax=Actinoplanes hulinensis TaxID=1144547 RepID=A0ABS7B0C3_9ACTN|nr:HAMP domain-containing sensor histidine kinase [Actinoplanes hulinensis]MBW6434435.1 HAMP domain-containing histidine kinase [Actinoplanes hulinensis]
MSAHALVVDDRPTVAPARTLRFSLVAGMTGLTAVALAITWLTAALVLRSYLLERIDDQLAAAVALVRQGAVPLPEPGPRSAPPVTDYLVEFRSTDGLTVRLAGGTPLPAEPLLDSADPAVPGPQTVRGAYRVRVVRGVNGTVLVGLPLAPVRDAVTRLAATAAFTAVTVLTLLTVLARWLVIRRLRPLEEIAATAGAIADGDLDRRVGAPEPGSPAARTEVGRLSVAVDGMLTRIQTSMAVMRTFVADASHELRTPLTSISGYLQLIRGGAVDLAARPDVLHRLEEASGRMGVLIDGLLYLARLESEPPARREPVDLAVLVHDAVTHARAAEPDRPLTVLITAPVTVVGDEGTLRRVLANLLGNVRAHTPPGTPARITVCANGDRVRVTVADQGPGMTAEAAGRAFERFWRADAARTYAGGFGLGLAIVAEVVRLHGGVTGIDTGDGVAVWFELPV